jgi:hypothetical protein
MLFWKKRAQFYWREPIERIYDFRPHFWEILFLDYFPRSDSSSLRSILNGGVITEWRESSNALKSKWRPELGKYVCIWRVNRVALRSLGHPAPYRSLEQWE